MNENLIEIKPEGNIKVSLMYAQVDNMFAHNFYADLGIDKCYAHKDMRPYLERLNKILAQKNLYAEIRDCYRPVKVQKRMWDFLPDERYVAPPTRGSKHNKGIAIDLVLCDKDGNELEFPTKVDGYRKDLIADFLTGNMAPVIEHLKKACHSYQSNDKAMQQAIANRDLLKSIMEEAGFLPLEEEWWHYELPHPEQYPIIESPL